MKHFASALVLAAAFAAPASAFTVDLSLPVLTFPQPTETTQGCISPEQLAAPACPVSE